MSLQQVTDGINRLISLNRGDPPGVSSNHWDSGPVHTPATDRSLTTTRHQIGVDGTLTSLKVTLLTGSTQRNLYIEVLLEDNNQQVVAKIMEGYVDVGAEPFGNGDLPVEEDWRIVLNSWSSVAVAPTLTLDGSIQLGKIETGGWSGVFETRTSGVGNLTQTAGTDPAAGAQIAETVPTNARWIITAFNSRMTADATSTTRSTRFSLDNGGGTSYFIGLIGPDQTASQARSSAAIPGWNRLETVFDSQTLHRTSLPIYSPLAQGFRIRTDVINFQAGDDWVAPDFLPEEWLTE